MLKGEKTGPRLSVVLPNYNHARYLRQAVESVLAQARPAGEIIIVDDASTDGSLPILEALAANEPRIKLVVRDRNSGAVAALNEGLALATGDFIAFFAADDFLRPDFLAVTAGLLERHPEAAFACGRAEIWDGKNRVTGRRPILWPRFSPGYVSAHAYRKLLRGSDNHFVSTVTLHRRKTFLDLGIFDESLGSLCDGLAVRRLAARHGFCFTPQILGAWRHEGSNYSIQAATDPQRLEVLSRRAADILANEPYGLFDDDYAQRLARRMRFGGARLLLAFGETDEGKLERLSRFGLTSLLDRLVFRMRRKKFSEAWAFFRLRPFSFAAVLRQLARQAFSLYSK